MSDLNLQWHPELESEVGDQRAIQMLHSRNVILGDDHTNAHQNLPSRKRRCRVSRTAWNWPFSASRTVWPSFIVLYVNL